MIDKINDFVLKLSSIKEEREIIEFTLDYVMEILKSESATYFSANDNKKILTFEIVRGPNNDILLGVSFSYEGVVGWCARHKKNIIVKNVDENPEFTKKVDYVTKNKTKSIISLVLINGEKLKGVFEFINSKDKDFFTDEDFKIAETLVNISSLKIGWN
jgi:GAF domain-containing protein